ncbi:uncharacterized protein [Dermacentor albipictus]|uniref:uncharacterized protein n=1 Tax=Dermacentor albipictus TaxID=60249 RepID=UPI0031FBDC5A
MAPHALHLLLLLGGCAALASARADLSSRLLPQPAMHQDHQDAPVQRTKAHHHLIEKWGLPLVVAAKHVVPWWIAGTAAVLGVLLAHSPLSPLPVPPLPHAPVGRFPPRQTVIKVPTPVHIVTVHRARRRRRAASLLSQEKPATPVDSMLVQGASSVNKLLQWLRRGGYPPNTWPMPAPSKLPLRPAAQMVLDTVVRLQPAQVLRAALAVSAAYRVLRLVGSVVAGAMDT